jgi:uncharacterized protein YkwD
MCQTAADFKKSGIFGRQLRQGKARKTLTKPLEREKRRTYGENISNGYKTEQSVIEGWIKSAGHCRNIMNPNVKEMGVAREGDYWTQVFGTRK